MKCWISMINSNYDYSFRISLNIEIRFEIVLTFFTRFCLNIFCRLRKNWKISNRKFQLDEYLYFLCILKYYQTWNSLIFIQNLLNKCHNYNTCCETWWSRKMWFLFKFLNFKNCFANIFPYNILLKIHM